MALNGFFKGLTALGGRWLGPLLLALGLFLGPGAVWAAPPKAQPPKTQTPGAQPTWGEAGPVLAQADELQAGEPQPEEGLAEEGLAEGGLAEEEEKGAEQERPAFKMTGLLQALHSTSQAQPDDQGYGAQGQDVFQSGQQNLRLQLEGSPARGMNWEAHWVLAQTQQPAGSGAQLAADETGSALFRRQSGRIYLEKPDTAATPDERVAVWHEVDRLSASVEWGHWKVQAGRMPVSWGVGRFWQPTDIFGAFPATTLDTSYRPGIDAAMVEYFPSSFSRLALVGAASPQDRPELDSAMALHWQGALGVETSYTLMATRALGRRGVGLSLETTWLDAGWLVEALASQQEKDEPRPFVYAVAGYNYSFANSNQLIVEWYHHSLGAVRPSDLATVVFSQEVLAGQQKQLSRDVLGVTLSGEITPLLSGGYLLLGAPLEDEGGRRLFSWLHQLSLRYSVADEADATFALTRAEGQGLSQGFIPLPQSEFGHLPASLYLQIRFFF